MSEWLNGIFECLDINSSTGLATEDSVQSMSPFQRLFYTQVHEKIGIDAVFFLRDANGIAKVPLIYFSVVHSLLSQSIFIKYLEERKDSNGETVFPQGFYSDFLESAKQYTDVLNSKEATYRLFRTLKEKFNGDTLQVSEVEISGKHLSPAQAMQKLLKHAKYLMNWRSHQRKRKTQNNLFAICIG